MDGMAGAPTRNIRIDDDNIVALHVLRFLANHNPTQWVSDQKAGSVIP
jgi:hypothetical protein